MVGSGALVIEGVLEDISGVEVFGAAPHPLALINPATRNRPQRWEMRGLSIESEFYHGVLTEEIHFCIIEQTFYWRMIMDMGMLWFDDNPAASMADKVTKAASYYASKYGRKPTICFVNPGMLDGKSECKTSGMEIRTSRTIQRHHFWLGIQQSSALS
jgi:hypothetical protein